MEHLLRTWDWVDPRLEIWCLKELMDADVGCNNTKVKVLKQFDIVELLKGNLPQSKSRYSEPLIKLNKIKAF